MNNNCNCCQTFTHCNWPRHNLGSISAFHTLPGHGRGEPTNLRGGCSGVIGEMCSRVGNGNGERRVGYRPMNSKLQY